jgi:predicted molibdopterin-dependent oxidoreductase YjgC
VQKLNAAMIPPDGALQDCDIFLRLLDAAGETHSYASVAEIFAVLAREIPSYKGLDYASIGDQGIELGSGRVEQHDR